MGRVKDGNHFLEIKYLNLIDKHAIVDSWFLFDKHPIINILIFFNPVKKTSPPQFGLGKKNVFDKHSIINIWIFFNPIKNTSPTSIWPTLREKNANARRRKEKKLLESVFSSLAWY